MEEEVKSWLKVVLDEKIDDFSVEILGNSEKGDGYLGDIVFVTLKSISAKPCKEHNLVLKCSKRSEILRKTTPVKEAFINEMYVYDRVLPAFTRFQLEKRVSEPFDSVPKCYGAITTENMEIIVLQNLKKIGYNLWDKKRPWTRNHINLVTREYAKFHSVSIAMKDQQPEKFEELCSGLTDTFEKFVKMTDFETIFGNSVDDLYNLFKGDFDDDILKNWITLREQTSFILGDMAKDMSGPKVIVHGDCWSNNFMFKNDPENKDHPLKVAILDWQVARYSSPIIDLSYFLFAGISKEDIQDVNDMLEKYYNNLKKFTAKLGSDLNVLYPKDQFFADWKKYCKFGILMASLVYKMCVTDTDEVIDVALAAENEDFGAAFSYEVKNTAALKNRASHVVQYVVENHLI